MPGPVAVIFDMDGVLIDSYAAHFESWQVLAAENDVEYSQAEFVAGFGRTSPEVIAEQWSAKLPELTAERILELDTRKEEIFRDLISADFPAMDGAIELLTTLHGAGVALAVGSSGPAENVNLVIDRLGARELFTAAVTGNDVKRGKPDPQVFLRAAGQLDVAADRCVVVEDAPVGVTATHAAGMKCIGFTSTGRSAEDLRKADLVVGSLREIGVEEILRLLRS